MSDAQIEELGSARTIPQDVFIVSPVNGFILSRNISAGQRFEKFTEFYRIADQSHVWIFAEVLGADAQAFRPGAIAKVSLPDTGRTLRARVSDVCPEVDPKLRIVGLEAGHAIPG